MAPFAGWEMPLEYSGTLAEHSSVREQAGVFDVSHLGKLMVEGSGAAEALDRALTNRYSDLAPGRARYTLMLDDDGGIVDDLIVYALSGDRYLAVPNAANAGEVEARLRRSAAPAVSVGRLEWATIAAQGPRSDRLVRDFHGADALGYMRCVEDGAAVVARSGYTGEHGYEIFLPAGHAPALWESLLASAAEIGGGPCGLGARDTLRLEMGYPLHGNDISREVTPAEAGLDWAADMTKEFVGRAAIERRPPRTLLRGLRMIDRQIPRRGHDVLSAERAVGRVTSGTFSPTLRIGVALAAMDPAVSEGDEVEVDVRGKRARALVVRPPFVDRSPKA